MSQLYVKHVDVFTLGGVGNMQVKNVTTSLTGSCYMLRFTYNNSMTKTILLDCGLHQGESHASKILNHEFKIDVKRISAVLCTHGHVDHCGRIPMLYAMGYTGKTYYSSPETLQIAHIQFEDCLKIFKRQYEVELQAFNKLKKEVAQAGELTKKRRSPVKDSRGNRRDKPSVRETQQAIYVKERILASNGVCSIDELAPLPPIYSLSDVANATSHAQVLEQEIPGIPRVKFSTYDTGHILGAKAIVIEWTCEKNTVKRIVFSGDLGSYNKGCFTPHGEPTTNPNLGIDAIFCETTYGGKTRAPDYYNQGLAKFLHQVQEEVKKGKTIVIPAFALDRATEVLYHLHKIHGAKIFFDTVSGSKFLEVYKSSVEDYKQFPTTYTLLNAETKKEYFQYSGAKIIVTSSGMCAGGPVIEYMKRYLCESNYVFIFTGYMHPSTPAGKLSQGAKQIYVDGKQIEVRAKILQYTFLSSHGDENALMQWLEGWYTHKQTKICLGHGDQDASMLAFKHTIERRQENKETSLKGVSVLLKIDKTSGIRIWWNKKFKALTKVPFFYWQNLKKYYTKST